MEIDNKFFRDKVANTLLDLICLCALNSASEIERFLLKESSNKIVF